MEHEETMAVLGASLPLLEELHCDLHSWIVCLARTPLARRIRRLGLPLWQYDKPVSSTFTGLESSLSHLLAFDCTERLEDLSLFGFQRMLKPFAQLTRRSFEHVRPCPIPVAPPFHHEERTFRESFGSSSLRSLTLQGFNWPQAVLTNLAAFPPTELHLLRLCFHREPSRQLLQQAAEDARRKLVEWTAPLRARCTVLAVEVLLDRDDRKCKEFAQGVARGVGPRARFRVAICSEC